MTADTFPPMEVDPRKVQRLERYARAYARLWAMDTLEHQRRYLAGLRFQMRLRCRPSRFESASVLAQIFNLPNRRKA